MTKQIDYQAVWNECLIKSWKANAPMFHFLKQFLLIVKPNYNITHELCDYYEFITNLNLKKCLDWRSGKLKFGISYNMPVRAYIDMHSSQLSNCLWVDIVPIDKIIKNLANFKWMRIGKSPTTKLRRNRKRRNKVEKNRTITIRARNLDKNHDWQIVK